LRTVAQRPLHVIGEAYDTRCIFNHHIPQTSKNNSKGNKQINNNKIIIGISQKKKNNGMGDMRKYSVAAAEE